MLFLKKAISRLLFPLPLSLILLFSGVGLLWSGRRRKGAGVLVLVGACLLFILSSEVVGTALLKPLEDRYEPFGPAQASQVDKVSYIVVFAGCVPSFSEYPITRQVGGTPLARLVEGVRLYHLYSESKLILSGGLNCDPEAPEETLTNYRFAVEMGVDPGDIVIERDSKDTKSQVAILKGMLGTESFLLVTSASHMPRAMAMFRKAGMNPIPAPTDYWTGLYGIFRRESIGPESFYPNATSLRKSERAIYEYLGLLWARLRGQI